MLVTIAAASLYFWSAIIINKKFGDTLPAAINIPRDHESIKEVERKTQNKLLPRDNSPTRKPSHATLSFMKVSLN